MVMRSITNAFHARRAGAIALLVAGSFVISGCSIGSKSGGSLRETLGLDKNAPDEFAIVTKAPLVVPPNYDLRPPQKGAEPLRRVDPRLSARTAAFGEDAARARGTSRGEDALLGKLGARNADGSIRRTLNRESAALTEKDKKLTSKVLFWQKKPQQGAVIDPKAEAARIKANKKAGKAVNEGATSMINCADKKAAMPGINCK